MNIDDLARKIWNERTEGRYLTPEEFARRLAAELFKEPVDMIYRPCKDTDVGWYETSRLHPPGLKLYRAPEYLTTDKS